MGEYVKEGHPGFHPNIGFLNESFGPMPFSLLCVFPLFDRQNLWLWRPKNHYASNSNPPG